MGDGLPVLMDCAGQWLTAGRTERFGEGGTLWLLGGCSGLCVGGKCDVLEEGLQE